jgi:uncharacterized membrane protein YtjA (UPF0391 family)
MCQSLSRTEAAGREGEVHARSSPAPRKMHRERKLREHNARNLDRAKQLQLRRMLGTSDFEMDAHVARFQHEEIRLMLDFSYFFFALAVIAALLGFLGLIGLAALVAKMLCLIFLILFVVATIRHRPH